MQSYPRNTLPDRSDNPLFQSNTYDRVRQPVPDAETLPPACYHDDAFYAWEVEHLFHGSWHCVGRTDQLPAPGDYRTFDLADAPLMLMRGADGTLRAFANVCRHRAMPLLDGEGNCDRIRCPFHSWTYALDGTLTGAPGMKETHNFNLPDYGLRPVRLDDQSSFVFINLSGDAPSLATHFGSFSSLHQPWHFEDLVTTRRHRIDVNCNWKLFIQVFMEYYHLGSVHARTFTDTRYAPSEEEQFDQGDFVSVFGTHEGTGAVLQSAAPKTFTPIGTLAGKLLRGTRYSQVYPSMALACTRDCMWFFECYPQGPDKSVFYMNSCFPAASTSRADFAQIAQAYYDRWDTAMAEDLVVLERQQTGVRSPQATPGRVSYLESAVGHFNRWLADRVVTSIS